MISGNGHIGGMNSGETLSQTVEIAFKDVVASKLNGKVPERVSPNVDARGDGHDPILSYIIRDEYSNTETRVDIAVGRSKEEGPYYAWIGRNYENVQNSSMWVNRNKRPQPENYQEFSSLEQLGYEAAKVFSHHHSVDTMSI